jgi:hypothetical protein
MKKQHLARLSTNLDTPLFYSNYDLTYYKFLNTDPVDYISVGKVLLWLYKNVSF